MAWLLQNGVGTFEETNPINRVEKIQMSIKPVILISYSCSDTRGHEEALYTGLEQRFGSNRVFRGSDKIRVGEDYNAHIVSMLWNYSFPMTAIEPRYSMVEVQARNRRREYSNGQIRQKIVTALNNGPSIVNAELRQPISRQTNCLNNAMFAYYGICLNFCANLGRSTESRSWSQGFSIGIGGTTKQRHSVCHSVRSKSSKGSTVRYRTDHELAKNVSSAAFGFNPLGHIPRRLRHANRDWPRYLAPWGGVGFINASRHQMRPRIGSQHANAACRRNNRSSVPESSRCPKMEVQEMQLVPSDKFAWWSKKEEKTGGLNVA